MEARERAKENGQRMAYSRADSSNRMAMTQGDMDSFGPAKGLTKRELFAAMAMQGILASPKFTKPEMREKIESTGVGAIEIVAMSAVDLADALLLALETEEKR